MQKKSVIIFLLLLFLFCINAVFAQEKKNESTAYKPFESNPAAYSLSSFIAEASGIADSKSNPCCLWVQEDSGNPPQLFLLNHDGKKQKTVYIKNAVNRDWEDMVLGNGPLPGKKYIYIGETGDNNAVHPYVSFYRFEEPSAETDTVRQYDIIRFTYEDGPRDAEAFLVDDHSKDIYIITKREKKSRLYMLSYPYSTAEMNKALFVQELSYNGVVSAAISSDAKEILIKTYSGIFYYTIQTGESIPAALQRKPVLLDYKIEPQGEALCFANGNTGFYTLSEKRMSSAQKLYFYKRK